MSNDRDIFGMIAALAGGHDQTKNVDPKIDVVLTPPAGMRGRPLKTTSQDALIACGMIGPGLATQIVKLP